MDTDISTDDALKALGVTESTLTIEEKRFLDENGYIALVGVLNLAEIRAICARIEELAAIERGLEGEERGVLRLNNLFNRGEIFKTILRQPRVLAALAHLLGSDMKHAALVTRYSLPGEGLQGLHADSQATPVEELERGIVPGYCEVANSTWLLDDFTHENGAPRFVPRTHLQRSFPGEVLSDLSAEHPDQQLFIGKAGTVFVFNGRLWHGGTRNSTNSIRRALHSSWTRRETPYVLINKDDIGSQARASFSPAEKFLLNI